MLQGAAARSSCFGWVLVLVVPAPSSSYSASSFFPKQNPSRLLLEVDDCLQQEGARAPDASWVASSTLEEVQREFEEDSGKFRWLSETKWQGPTKPLVPCEWVGNEKFPQLALQTRAPVMDAETVSAVRCAAEAYWSQSESVSSSFTYQREGNYEAHLGDLCALDSTLRAAMQMWFQEVVFPLVRHYYFLEDCNLFVYDSLVIRYNATENKLPTGAGQPLHRDLGLVSVNVMLNSPDEFQGGGTFFEAQLRGDNNDKDKDESLSAPLKPFGTGHALFHKSNYRHAGAGTRLGVRDILVVFLSAVKDNSSGSRPEMYPLEKAARIRGKSLKQKDFRNRALLHRLSLQVDANDNGEAFHYLGLYLREMSLSKENASLDTMLLQLAQKCMMHATFLLPNDARLWGNLAICLAAHHQNDDDNDKTRKRVTRLCFQEALLLHQKCLEVGCDVWDDFESAVLQYGLFLANEEEWGDAVKVLHWMDEPSFGRPPSRKREDAIQLREFCRRKKSTQVVQPK